MSTHDLVLLILRLSLSSSLLFSDSSHLCFSSVHIVVSLASKLPLNFLRLLHNGKYLQVHVHIYIYIPEVCIYIYIYIHTAYTSTVCLHIYIYIYTCIFFCDIYIYMFKKKRYISYLHDCIMDGMICHMFQDIPHSYGHGHELLTGYFNGLYINHKWG